MQEIDFSEIVLPLQWKHDFQCFQRIKIDQKRFQEAPGEVFYASLVLFSFLVRMG